MRRDSSDECGGVGYDEVRIEGGMEKIGDWGLEMAKRRMYVLLIRATSAVLVGSSSSSSSSSNASNRG